LIKNELKPTIIDITGKSIAEIKTEIEAALAANNVRVTGTNITQTTTLALSIPAGKTVTWEAHYESSPGSSSGINLEGAGDFVINGHIESDTSDAVIYLTGNFSGRVIVESGGYINSTSSGGGIGSSSPLFHTIIVDGGTIESETSAIVTTGSPDNNATIFIRNGTITGKYISSHTIELSGRSRLHISGGTITNTSSLTSVIYIIDNSIIYVSGSPIIEAYGISRSTPAIGYYENSTHEAMFDTTGGTASFILSVDLFNTTPPSPQWW
jgi:hypothetical protein